MKKMEEYYKVLHFLKYDDVDRIYPCEEYFVDYDEIDETEISVPYRSNRFLFQTNKDTFTGLDYVSILLETSEPLESSEFKLNFSEFVEGYAPYIVLDCNDIGELPVDEPVQLKFPVQEIQQMSDKSRNITGIRSIELLTPNNQAITVRDIAFRHDNASYTIEQLDMFIENGKYYILSRLHLGYDELPEELEDHVYTAAAGYAWSAVWEFEARIMNDEQKNAKSYGKWLFAEVDDAIANYKEMMNIDENIDFVVEDLTSWTPLRW